MGGSLSQMSATCSSLMEWSVNRHALSHERCFGDRPALLSWVRGVHAAAQMRESAALLWGGTYAVKMEQLQDDIPLLKSFMIRDMLQEDQYVLIKRAEEIIATQKERIGALYDWMTGNGLEIHRDDEDGHAGGAGKAGGAPAGRPGPAFRARLGEHPRSFDQVPARDLRGVRGQRLHACPRLLPFTENETGHPVRRAHRVRGGHQGPSHLHAPARHQPRGAPRLR